MNALRLKKYKTMLLELENRLIGEIRELEDEVDSNRKAIGERDGDPSEEINTEIVLTENELAELTEVRAALSRIAAETFGFCQDCERMVSAPRLNVIPHTPFCIECERARETNGIPVKRA